MRNFPALWGHACETGKHYLQQCSSALLILKPSMAFKIPLLHSLSLTKGYFHDIPNFRLADVTDKDEIGKGSFSFSRFQGWIVPKKNINQCLIVFVFPRVPRRRDSGAIGFFHHVSGFYGYALNTVKALCTNHPGEVDN